MKNKDKQTNDVAAVVSWRVVDLVPYPDNPRAVNEKSAKFLDLVESIRSSGVLDPLTVRRIAGNGASGLSREVLSGHRRLRAAQVVGLEEVPVRDLGELPDSVAYDIVAMSNLHEDLTPLEEGRLAAGWLDKYQGDVETVASKLGKTPAWVVQHAQIARGLSATWQAAAGEERFCRWTASHWAVIARLPVSAQAKAFERLSDGHVGCAHWSVKQLEEDVRIETLVLVKAPFDPYVCRECIDRTDRQPLLWAELAEDATGDKARCLNAKCWQKKCVAYAKKQFRDVCEQKGVPGAVPISLVEEPKDWSGREAYGKKIRELKKQYKGLLTMDRFSVVEQGDDGAIAGIVVAGGRGRGHLAVKYIRPADVAGGGEDPGRRDGSGPDVARAAADRAAAAVERNRWLEVSTRLKLKIQAAERPSLAILTVVSHSLGLDSYGWLEEAAAVYRAKETGPQEFAEWVADLLWREVKNDLKPTDWPRLEEDECAQVGTFFGIDVEAIYDEVVAAEQAQTPEVVPDAKPAPTDSGDGSKGKKKDAGGAAPRKKAKKVHPNLISGVCVKCGCTDEDCSACRDRTGEPCHWVDEAHTLCSACAEGKPTREELVDAGADVDD